MGTNETIESAGELEDDDEDVQDAPVCAHKNAVATDS